MHPRSANLIELAEMSESEGSHLSSFSSIQISCCCYDAAIRRHSPTRLPQQSVALEMLIVYGCFEICMPLPVLGEAINFFWPLTLFVVLRPRSFRGVRLLPP